MHYEEMPQITSETIEVQAANEKPLSVGSRIFVMFTEKPGEIEPQRFEGTVTKITDPDADYDDNLERGVEYPPQVTVKFDDGMEDTYGSYNNGSIGYPDVTYVYICEDVEAV